MADNTNKHSTRDTSQTPSAVHHRQRGTPTKSTNSRQRSQSRHTSPACDKKRKRDASEPSDDAAMVSRPGSRQPTLSSTEETVLPPLPPTSLPQISISTMGTSASMASINPGDGVAQDTHEISNDQQSSAPKQDISSEDGVVWRSKEKLGACLSCDLCDGVLKDPVTAPECMHSFCRDCIDQHVLFGGTKNICPVCKSEGLQTVLGPQPFQHGKLQFDPMLADMIRKLFPRADVEKSIQERHNAEAKFRASLPVKKLKTGSAKTPPQSALTSVSVPSPAAAARQPAVQASTLQSSQVGPTSAPPAPSSNARVGLFLQIVDTGLSLSLPYLWVQQSMPLKSLGSYVSGQLQLDTALHQPRLECEGALLHPTATLQSVCHQWYRHHPANDLVVINVGIEQNTAHVRTLMK